MDENEKALTERFIEAYGRMQRMRLSNVHPELSQGEYYLLKSVRSLSGSGGAHVAELVEKQGVSPQAVSRMLHGLERRKFISRVVSSSDRRASFVRLTDRGARLLGEAGVTAEAFAGRVIDELGEERTEELLELLEELEDIVRGERETQGGAI